MSSLTRRRNVALVLSALVLPGAGQFYNRQFGKGLLVLAGFLVPSLVLLTRAFALIADLYGQLTGLTLAETPPELNVWAFVQPIVIAAAFYVWGLVDSYTTAARLEERESRAAGGGGPER